MGSGTVGAAGFSLCQCPATLAEVWSTRWPHVQWVSCCPPKTEGEAGPSCLTRQDLLLAEGDR